MNRHLLRFSFTRELIFASRRQIHGDRREKSPAIGILTQTTKRKMIRLGDQFFPASYVKWLESAGAHVIPVKVNQSSAYYERLFGFLNGILLPGGAQNLTDSGYAIVSNWFLERSKAALDQENDYFPIWGTCLGFEQLLVIAGQVRSHELDLCAGTKNVCLPLKFTPNSPSRLLTGGLKPETLVTMATEGVAPHFNKWGFYRSRFEKNDVLKDFFEIVATVEDEEGNDVVTFVESKRYPVYANQFHPEKVAFEHGPELNITRTETALRATLDLAAFFVEEARRSSHAFPDAAAEHRASIRRRRPVETLKRIGSVYEECYFFDEDEEEEEEEEEED